MLQLQTQLRKLQVFQKEKDWDSYIPTAVDRARANLDRISRVMKKARNDTLACSMDWDATSFEEVADEINTKDREHGSNFSKSAFAELRKLRSNFCWYRQWNSIHIYNESTRVGSPIRGRVH